jgi:hypothetical protein
MTKNAAIEQAENESSITFDSETSEAKTRSAVWKVTCFDIQSGAYKDKCFRRYKNAEKHLELWRYNRVCRLLEMPDLIN